VTLGTLAWADVTGGAITWRDRARFLGPALRQTAQFVAGRLRLALGGQRGPAGFDLATFTFPDTALARAALEEAVETLTPAMLGHSRRTFVYGLALAGLDGVPVDVEHLYATSLLHDICLETPDGGGCFAVRGGPTMRQVALDAGEAPATADLLATAITDHITPGVRYADGALAPLLQFGAMVDLTGLRLWDLDPEFVQSVLDAEPRHALKEHLPACWVAEARAFPRGRAAFIERAFLFSWLVRMAPFRE